MKLRLLLTLLLVVFSSPIIRAESSAGFALAEAPIDKSDMESIKRGAKFFASNCMACHTAVYLRYNKLAADAGVTYEKMPINVKSWPNNIRPPDLSLEAGIRGVDWIYTYLHVFYKDPSRPSGVNNLLVPGTAMPNILGPYQGDQVLVKKDQSVDALYSSTEWYDLLNLTAQGSMTPEQFDETMADVTNFLAYAAEPYRAEQHRLGWWVLGFLAILFFMMYFLKKEYWKDVKKHKN